MCGIFAYLDKEKREEIKKDFNLIKHRGPDHSGFKDINGYKVGCHRLAIVGSKRGNQPIVRDEVTLVCNGQIYNINELSKEFEKEYHSDCEVIIDLYNKYGIEECCRKLDGVFAFVLIDKNKIYVARDMIGVRPLFYGINDNEKSKEIIAFASEFKSIKWCKEIKVFPPSNIWSNETNKFVEYKNIIDIKYEINNQEINLVKNNVKNLIINSIYKRLIHTNRPIAFLLSGGIDSSIILVTVYNLLKRIGKENRIAVFTMRYDNKNSVGEDYQYAKMLTESLKIKHYDVKFTNEDIYNNLENVIYHIESYDPNTIRASIPMYLLAKYIKDNTEYRVILSGEGADELFMGYSYFNKTTDNRELNEESRRLIKNLHQFDLLRADRCMSAFGLDLRVPYLDRYLVEYVNMLSGEYKKYKNNEEKHLLRQIFREEKSYEILKRLRILDRQKEKFSDGVGFNYVPRLIEKGNSYIKDNEWKNKYIINPPKTPEEYMYRDIFEKFYNGKQNIIIKRLLPSWCKQISHNVPLTIGI